VGSISIGPACRLDISESMIAQWQGHGDKEGRKGMNNGYLYHGGQWDLHRNSLAEPLYGDALQRPANRRCRFANGVD
jgi:hypothetical protein